MIRLGKYSIYTGVGVWRSDYPYKFCPSIKFGKNPVEISIQLCFSKRTYRMIFLRDEVKYQQILNKK